MRFVALLFLGLMLTAGMARAQETSRGWLGVNLAGLTKAEADALGWKTPRGVKVVKPLPGGPAEAAGVQAGDILWLLDGMEIETPKAFAEALAKRAAGTEIRLAIQRAGREERVAVTLGTRPARVAAAKRKVAEDAPIPMLDTGGHMSRITGIAFTPDGKFIVSAGDDKVIRIWDWRAGKTVRTILGQSGPADAGQIYALALSSDGRWLAVGGWMRIRDEAGHHIRLYDFASADFLIVEIVDVYHRHGWLPLRGPDADVTAVGSRHRAFDHQNVLHEVDFHHLEVAHRHLGISHVAGHAGTGKHARWIA
jgi:hypothetical protein